MGIQVKADQGTDRCTEKYFGVERLFTWEEEGEKSWKKWDLSVDVTWQESLTLTLLFRLEKVNCFEKFAEKLWVTNLDKVIKLSYKNETKLASYIA